MEHRLMRRLAALVGGLALVLVSGSTALASHAWGDYHWERSSDSLALVVASNLDSRYTDPNLGHFGMALKDWNTSSVLNLSAGNGAGLDKCGPVAGRVEVCNDAYGYRNGGWLGVATIWASGNHITQATVKLNDTFLHGGGTYDSDPWRQMVMCQEIGHVFGLDHQDENFDNANLGTCMDYTRSPESNQHPNDHDYQMLDAIYTHTDSVSGGGGGGSCPGKKPSCKGAAGNAPPFSKASRANGSIYVDRLANGMTRITHVFWVPRR
jgi:hypothetical protein